MSPHEDPSLQEDLRLKETASDGEAEAWLWWTEVPELLGERLGVIGKFRAHGREATRLLLDHACRELARHGCTLAVGPMDGNTWRKYRLLSDPGTEPPFFLEPTNPFEWLSGWTGAGFGPLAEYYSSATTDLTVSDPRLARVAERMKKRGVEIRGFDPNDFEKELKRIFEVSLVSFRDNYLYTPLPEEAFIAQYRPLKAMLVPELVLLAELGGHPIGYVFAVPDLAQKQRGELVTTAIVKTLAVLPGRDYAGLGALLLGEVHLAAARLGFTRAIHALMHESNQSRNLSAHYAATIRRYVLLSKRLSP